MAEHNPYHPYLPPDNPTLFYGRQEATAFLRQHLVGAHNKHIILILGRIGMGKTSLLHHVNYIVDERYHPVYIDATAINLTNTASFITFVVNAIVSRMEFIGASTYRVPDMPENADEQTLRRWFADDFLDVVLTAIRRDRFLLLMIDDLQVIFNAIKTGKLPSNFMDFLGSLLEQHERLDIAAALDVTYEEQALGYAQTANVNFQYRLGHLNPQAVRQLIIDPSQDAFRYTDDAIERILDLCGGYPFLLHSVCRLLYRHRESNPSSIVTAETIDYVYIPTLEETGEVLREWWNKAAPNTRIAVRALLSFREQAPNMPVSQNELRHWIQTSGTTLNETQLFSTLRALEYDAIVKTTEDGSYYFSTGLEANWLAENLRDADSKQGQPSRLPNATHLIGILGIVATILIIGAVVLFGLSGEDDEAKPDQDAPPTSTFALDIEATRRAENDEATSRAIPSSTITPSATATHTHTSIPTETFTPSRTPTITDTATPTDTAEPSNTPTNTSTNTRTPTRTPRPTSTVSPSNTDSN